MSSASGTRGRTSQRSGKIRDIDELAGILDTLKKAGTKIVNCHGVFDLLHIGHIRHLSAARRLGDTLVVTLTQDRHVNKGPHRPAFNQELRAEALAALDCVDYVAINRWPTAIEAIKLLKPDVYVKGAEYRDPSNDRTGNIGLEEEAVVQVGGEVAFTDDLTFSSSRLINNYLSVLPQEATDFLRSFTERHRARDVFDYLEGARGLRVLVTGETIIDEYQYCEMMGKSGKEPVLAARYLSSEKFAGGILAVANNVATFSDNVGMVTALGSIDSHEEFILEKIDDKIEAVFLAMQDAPTIVKRRFVEAYPFQKLFEIYVMNGRDHDPAQTRDLCTALDDLLPRYDVVIVTDYGHGLLAPEAVELLCDRSKFLAVNTQVNADNRGFNMVSRYRRADYICVSENEIRLEARSRHRDLKDIMLEVSDKLSCDRILITCGERGCVCYERGQGFAEVPALTGRVVDRTGAGDTVLAVTSLCVAQGAPMELVGLIGNAVGAQAVAMVANRKALERVSLLKHLEALLK